MTASVVKCTAPSVVVTVRGQLYAFDASAVAEMATLSGVQTIPQVPPDIRGVINLRGRVLTVVDLRSRLGMPSAATDLEALLTLFSAREQDHRRWIDELDAALTERREFRLTLDPHACAFGRWYDGLKTDDFLLATQLKKIDEPHQRIHRRGAEALACAAAGRHEEALAISHHIRTHELAITLALFEDTRRLLRESQREVAVIARRERGGFAVAVDGVDSVERLLPVDASEATDALLSGSSERPLHDIRRRSRDGSLVLLVDLERLLDAA